MTRTEKTKKKFPMAALVVALLFLVNGNMGTIDFLPDCISYFIFSFLLKRAADIAPHFDEAKAGFRRLALVDLAKFCCILLLAAETTSGRGDLSAMLSLTFGIGESVLFFGSTRALFGGLYHLGQRTDADGLYLPFSVGIRKKMAPEKLEVLIYGACIAKNMLAAVPDFFRLSANPDADALSPARFYPSVLIFCTVLVTLLGAVCFFLCVRYAVAVRRAGISQALDDFVSLTEGGRTAYLEKRQARREEKVLWIFVIATLFTVPLTFDSLGGLSLIPPFLFPLLCLFMLRAADSVRRKAAVCMAVPTLAVSLVTYVIKAVFFETYSYSSLLYYEEARSLYRLVSVASVVEAVLTAALFPVLARFFVRFALSGTERFDFERRRIKAETWRMAAFGAFAAALRGADAVLHGMVRTVYANPNEPQSSPTLTVGVLPWLPTVTVIVSALFVLFVLYYRSSVRDFRKLGDRTGGM